MENEFASKLNFFEEKVKNYDYSIESFRQKLAALAREVEACKEALRQPTPTLPAQLEALQSKINNFEQALQSISQHQSTLQKELLQLKSQYQSLQSSEVRPENLVQAPLEEISEESPLVEIPEKQEIENVFTEVPKEEIAVQPENITIDLQKPVLETTAPKVNTEASKEKFSLEDYIGGNLISKIGIVILVLGLGTLLKYAIEQELLSDLVKVLLAYGAGLGLFGLSLYLKNKYFSYSAVLLSGALATLYFTTYFAYDTYAMLGQVPAFGILFLISAYAVYASAWQYRQEIIGLIGLVGAYAVPLLLGGEQGNIQVLLLYILLIDIIILLIAFRLQWAYTSTVAFFFTWASYLTWFSGAYKPEQDWMAIVFGGAYFLVFQLMVLAYKFFKEQPLRQLDIALLLLNNFIFYTVGMLVYKDASNARVYFSLANALLQGGFAALALRIKDRDPKVHYLFLGFALIFVGIAAFVAFRLQWLVAFVFAEALLLLAIGRIKQERFYERIAYIVASFAFLFLINFWGDAYQNTSYEPLPQKVAATMFFNGRFVVSLAAILCLIGAVLLDMRYPLPSTPPEEEEENPEMHNDEKATLLPPLFSQILQGLLLIVCYASGYLELQEGFLSGASETRVLVLSAYSMLFLMAAGLCIHFIKQWRWMRLFWELAVGFQVLLFLSLYYPTLDLLRSEAFVALRLPEVLWPRALYLGLFGGLLALYYFLAIKKLPAQSKVLFSIGLQLLALWLLSNEVHTAYLLVYPDAELALLNNTVYYQLYFFVWTAWSALLLGRYLLGQKQHYLALSVALFSLALLKAFFIDGHSYAQAGDAIYLRAFFFLLGYSVLLDWLYTTGRLKVENTLYQNITLIKLGLMALMTVFWLFPYILNQQRDLYLQGLAPDPYSLWRYALYLLVLLQILSVRQVLRLAPDTSLSNALHLGTIFWVMWALGWEITQIILFQKQGLSDMVAAKQDISRLPYTLVWSLYAFGLTVYGFAARKKLFRFSGLGILAIVLLKVLLWDLQYTNTLSKVITFISFGALLLLVSFLYQKFKHLLLMEDK